MSNDLPSICSRAEALRDYAFDELPVSEQPAMEAHLGACPHCTLELDRLRVTTAALRALPDREIPQRISFVSDKVFEPSGLSRWLGGFWNSAARLGFASVCVLVLGLIAAAWVNARRPAAVRTVLTSPAPKLDVSAQVNEAVSRAVSQIRAEDAKATRAALDAVNRKHEQEHREIMVAMQENFEFLQKHLNTNTMLASSEAPGPGAGQ